MMVLEYLVPSKARRDLLAVLQAQKRGRTVRQLAQEAEVTYSNAHKELQSMRQLGLVRSERVGASVVCRWDPQSPAAKALAPLLKQVDRNEAERPSEETVLRSLKRHGAPLAMAGSKGTALPLEETLGYALASARKHPEVARVWPVVFAKHRSRVDQETLRRLAGRLGQKRALGFLLELTQTLLGDLRSPGRDKPARDRRFTKTQDFFAGETSKRARELADLRTPAVARKWHFRMNMPMESFQSAFDKFAARES